MSSDRAIQFDVMSIARYAWSKVSGSKTPILLAALFCAFIQMMLSLIGGLLATVMSEAVANLLVNIIALFVLMPAYVGLMYMGLQRVRGLPLTFNQVFYAYRKDLLIQIWIFYLCFYGLFFVGALIGGILSVIPAIGMILVIVLGLGILYLLVRCALGVYLIFDQNEKAIDALKHSFSMTKPFVWQLILSYILLFVVMFVGALTLMIGLIWAIPFAYIFYAAIYQTINGGVLEKPNV